MGKRKRGREEGGLASVQKALIAAGGSIPEAAKRLVASMDAEYIEVVKHQGTITDEKAYVDHPTRLKAATTILEIHAPRARGKTDRDDRPILNIQAGAKVQLVFFGKAIEPMPEAPGVTVPSTPAPMSDPLTAQLIRSGRILPSGEAVKPVETKTEVSKVLPEPNPKRDGWVRE